jgi:hypothetical protein
LVLQPVLQKVGVIAEAIHAEPTLSVIPFKHSAKTLKTLCFYCPLIPAALKHSPLMNHSTFLLQFR